jgi:hypothetical protein
MPRPVKLIALLKAKPGMTREEFPRQWVEGHAPLTLSVADADTFTVVRTHIYTEEYVLK